MNSKHAIRARPISAASFKISDKDMGAQCDPAAVGTPTPARLAAGITVPKLRSGGSLASSPASLSAKADVPGLHVSLEQLIDEIGPKASKHDVVTALIYMCIGEGLNTDSQIIGTIYRLGYDNRHVAIMLKKGTGLTAAGGSWRRNADKTYALLT